MQTAGSMYDFTPLALRADKHMFSDQAISFSSCGKQKKPQMYIENSHMLYSDDTQNDAFWLQF